MTSVETPPPPLERGRASFHRHAGPIKKPEIFEASDNTGASPVLSPQASKATPTAYQTSHSPQHGHREPRKSRSRPNISGRRNTSSKSSGSTELTIPPRLSLWSYMVLEVRGGVPDAKGFGDEKVENLLNVISIPWYLEKVLTFGMLTCLDSFLHAFTILPLRVVYALYSAAKHRAKSEPVTIKGSKRSDLIKGFIVLTLFWTLMKLDTSRIYHSIRGQAAIKLYVMFNVLEIADKLCAALGQDILECLFSAGTLAQPLKTAIFTALLFIYSYIHALVLLYQIITLNVAVNSYSNALLTLLLSNQFSEIKGTVFKKFERENLFQLTCADITERFQLLVMLLVVGVRNVVEVSAIGIIPASWAGWNRWLGALFGPACVVVGSEIMVDWLKHAYIIKFNNIRPRVYKKYLDVLAIDYAENAFSDQTMTKRTGLPVFPLVAVTAKMVVQSYYLVIEQTAPTTTYPESTPTLSMQGTSTPGAVLEKIDKFFSSKGIFHISPSTLYFSANLMLACLIVFLVTLIMKLVLGLLLLNYATRKHIQHTSKYRTRRSAPSTTAPILSKPPAPPFGNTAQAPPAQPALTAESDFAPDRNSGFGVVKLDEADRHGLYDPDEDIPELKISKQGDVTVGELFTVTRFKMVAKRIW